MSQIVDDYRKDFRRYGFFYRMTEWHHGVQACIFLKTDVTVCIVGDYRPTEEQAVLDIFPRFQELIKEKQLKEMGE
jgi:hypothetical protein